MGQHQETRDYTEFLERRAEELGVTFPPLGKTPRRWTKSLQTPRGTPPELSGDPRKYIFRLLWLSWRPLALQTLLMTISSAGGALVPYLMGTMINGVIVGGFDAYTRGQAGLFLLLAVVIALSEGISQLSGIATWMGGSLVGAWAVGRRISKAGRAAKGDTPAGEVVTAMVNDSDYVGGAFVWLPEIVANLASVATVLFILFRVSVPLGWVVAIGVPIAIILVTLLARPLQTKLAVQREEQGQLTSISTDAVAGLRVLRGIGGESVYNQRYREQSQRVKDAGVAAAGYQAALVVLRNSVPQLLIAAVIGFGAYLVFTGQVSAGALVSFYGYALYMRMPIGAASAVVQHWTRGWVGAKKLSKTYSLEPGVFDERVDPSVADARWGEEKLEDVRTGIGFGPGTFTALVSATPERTAELARRLARTSDAEDAEDTDNTASSGAATLGGVDLRAYPLNEVRGAVYLSESSPQLFRESLQDAIRGASAPNPPMRGVTELVCREHLENSAREEDTLTQLEAEDTDLRLRESLHVAAAADVEDSLPGGTAGMLAEKARNISGGQRQRVALARAVWGRNPILILVEPTSAVDAHTEAQIAQRLRRDREGLTTIVATSSPLLLSVADEVVVVAADGSEVGRGAPDALWNDQGSVGEEYRRIISREVDPS